MGRACESCGDELVMGPVDYLPCGCVQGPSDLDIDVISSGTAWALIQNHRIKAAPTKAEPPKTPAGKVDLALGLSGPMKEPQISEWRREYLGGQRAKPEAGWPEPEGFARPAWWSERIDAFVAHLFAVEYVDRAVPSRHGDLEFYARGGGVFVGYGDDLRFASSPNSSFHAVYLEFREEREWNR